MSTFDHLKLAVEKMEQGYYPPPIISNSDRVAAIQSLEDQICSTSWKTAEERERAQGLVARLERIKHSLQEKEKAGPGQTSSPLPS